MSETMPRREPLKVGISGVRGIIGASLTPQIATGFAQAFGAMVGRGPVVVGRDTRPSGIMLEQAVICGLLSVGCQPLLAGVVPTPTILHLTRSRNARGGICITASHNGSAWNALKFVDRNGMFLRLDQFQEFVDIYHQQNFPLAFEPQLRDVEIIPTPAKGHLENVLDYVDVSTIRARKFRVAVDCCNGAGALYSADFLEKELGCDVFPILDNPTGRFEREPEPTPENLSALAECVLKNRCDIGFAQDPDADRLALVDETGFPIGEDLTLAFAIEQVLSRHGKGPVVVNLSSSRRVIELARRHEVDVHLTAIGEIHVATALLEKHAVVGGEPNGGVIIPAIHPCRDSYAGMAVILELLAHSRRTLSDWCRDVPSYHMIKDKVHIRAEMAPEYLRRFRKKYAAFFLNLTDGVHIDFGNSWMHVRASNTEPVMRIIAEAKDERRAKALIDEGRALIDA